MPNGQKYEDLLKSKGRRGGWRKHRPFITALRNEFPRKAKKGEFAEWRICI